MNRIQIQHLTKDYGHHKGVFDVNLTIEEGQVYGYLGPNGAGKSTTMRHLMGFSKPDHGIVHIADQDCWSQQKSIQNIVGYLPGEISFPDDMTGMKYLKLIAAMRNMKDFHYAQELLTTFELDPNTSMKRMSKGMKQKIGIVSAFMHNPSILLLDEPTSGLDPLMQNRFIELIASEKKKGKTILLSSHLFEEVEKTCDRIGMIRNGQLQKEFTIEELRHSQRKTYQMECVDQESFQRLQAAYPNASVKAEHLQITITIQDHEINPLINVLASCQLRYLKEEKHTLEEYFMQFYGGDSHV